MAHVSRIEVLKSQHVYDINVEQFHNYIANGIVVHNCQKIAQIVAGFDPITANQLRKVISKKNKEELPKMKQKFLDGAQKRILYGELTQDEAEYIWTLLESFGSYGFNLSHAISYSAITAVEFWLKFHFPAEYIAALMNNTSPSKKKFGTENLIVEYISYARRHHIEVLPPDINKSRAGFCLEDGKIRYALGHIKNVGTSAVDIEEYQPFTSVSDFWQRVNKRKINKKVMVSLIASGVFSEFGTRNEVWKEYCVMRHQGDRPPLMSDEKWDAEAGKELTKNDEKLLAEINALQPASLEEFYEQANKRRYGKRAMLKLISLGAFRGFGTRSEVLESYYELRNKEDDPVTLTKEGWTDKERELLGCSLSQPPILRTFADSIKKHKLCTISMLSRRNNTTCFGRIDEIKPRVSKAGNNMFVVRMSDDIDTLSFYVFEKGKLKFQREFHVGNIVGVPLSKFDDSQTRFYNAYSDGEIIIQR